MLKKNKIDKRNFLKKSIGFISVLILSTPFINNNNYIKKKFKIYKKKYAKVWVLDINDS